MNAKADALMTLYCLGRGSSCCPAGLVKLTAETYSEGMQEVFGDEKQCHMYHIHPLMLPSGALNQSTILCCLYPCD